MLNFAQQTRVMCLASLAFSLASSARIVQFFCCCAVSLYRFCQHNDDILRLKLFPYFSLEISHPHYKYYTILSGVSLCQTFFPFCTARLGLVAHTLLLSLIQYLCHAYSASRSLFPLAAKSSAYATLLIMVFSVFMLFRRLRTSNTTYIQ